MTTPRNDSRAVISLLGAIVSLAVILYILLISGFTRPVQAQNQGPKSSPIRRSGVTNTSNTVVGTGAIIDTIHCFNNNAAATYLQLFNVASATTVTPGTTLPDQSFGIPANTTDPQLQLTSMNLWFGLGIKIIATTTATGSTAPGTAIDCNFQVR